MSMSTRVPSALVRESGVTSRPRDRMAQHGTGGEVAYDLLSPRTARPAPCSGSSFARA